MKKSVAAGIGIGIAAVVIGIFLSVPFTPVNSVEPIGVETPIDSSTEPLSIEEPEDTADEGKSFTVSIYDGIGAEDTP